MSHMNHMCVTLQVDEICNSQGVDMTIDYPEKKNEEMQKGKEWKKNGKVCQVDMN